MQVSSRAIPEKTPANRAGERRATRLSAMRVSIDRLSLTGTLASINEYFALYDKVTSADVKRVAQFYFTPNNRTVVTLKAGK